MAQVTSIQPDPQRNAVLESLDSLTTAVVTDLERGITTQFTFWGLLLLMTKIADASFNTIRHLCGDGAIVASDKRVLFAVSTPSLLRSLVDELFTVVCIGEDVPVRMPQYLRGGWRELREAYERLLIYQGKSQEWDSWLAANRGQLGKLQVDFRITDQEAKNINYWPSPSQMLRGKMFTPANHKFLEYMEDWFYRQLSQADHLSLPGLIQRGVPLCSASLFSFEGQWFERAKAQLPLIYLMNAIVLYLTVLTEIILLCGFDLKPQCASIWGILRDRAPVAAEVWQERYAGNCRACPPGASLS